MEDTNQQVCTREVSAEDMWRFLRRFLVRCSEVGITDVEMLFGFAWGNRIYPSGKWEYIRLPIADVEGRIREEEAKQNGQLGRDDLYIYHVQWGFELQLCHESDMHIWFHDLSPLMNDLIQDWRDAGFEPVVWRKENDKWLEQGC
jgi:hypothetical protein